MSVFKPRIKRNKACKVRRWCLGLKRRKFEGGMVPRDKTLANPLDLHFAGGWDTELEFPNHSKQINGNS